MFGRLFRRKPRHTPPAARPIRLRMKRLGRRLGLFRKPIMGARIPPTPENIESGYWGTCVTTRRHRELVELFEQYEVPKDARILDVGCSKGFLAAALAHHGWTGLTGCDRLVPDDRPPDQKDYVDFRHLLDYRRIDLDIDGLAPLPADAFDVVVCSEVLEHLEAPSFLFKEFQRVLRPGGRVFMEVPNTGNVFEKLRFLRTSNFSRYAYRDDRSHRTHISIFTPDVIRLLAVRSDFEIVDFVGGYAMFWNEFLFPGRKVSTRWSYGLNVVLHSVRTTPWTDDERMDVGRTWQPAAALPADHGRGHNPDP